ncbi:MAG: MFS transporter [Acidimicrobiales bacterium]
MGVRERGDQFRRLVRSALHDLFDQRRPVGRLSLTHVLMKGGDTVFAVSLAGSLFFSISPTAAKDKVLLYLLLTMGPFAVVAPVLGPLIDRSRGARRAVVVASGLGRVALCPFLARDLHSLLLFPEAFAMLVLSKVYVITKGALVPEMAAMGMLDASGRGTTGAGVGSPSEVPVRSVSPPTHTVTPILADRWRGRVRTPPYGTPPYGTPPYGTPPTAAGVPPQATGHPARVPNRTATGPSGEDQPDLATLNARLGLLSSLSGFVFAVPAVAALKLGGPSSVLWVAVGVFAAATVAAARLPLPGREQRRLAGQSPSTTLAPDPLDGVTVDPERAADEADLAALRPIADAEVNLALMPMSVLKALIGFVTFLMAFALRRADAATWWFGVILGSLTVGALLGVLLVGRMRRILSEQQILIGSLWMVAGVTLIGALFPARGVQALVVGAIGFAVAVAVPCFDALVQQHVRPLDQGKAFARFETRLQLMWVVGSFVPVVLALSVSAGNYVMSGVAAAGSLSYLSSRRAIRTSPHRTGRS